MACDACGARVYFHRARPTSVESVGAGGERPAWPRPDGAARAADVRTKAQGARWVAMHRPRRRRPPPDGMVSVCVPLEGLRGRRGAR